LARRVNGHWSFHLSKYGLLCVTFIFGKQLVYTLPVLRCFVICKGPCTVTT
jgi:hypothetical protein